MLVSGAARGGTSFEAEVTDLRESAKAARSAADQAGRVDSGAALTAASPGVPGAQAVEAFAKVSARWARERDAWVAAARRYGSDLDAAAAAYRGTDQSSQAALGRAVREP